MHKQALEKRWHLGGMEAQASNSALCDHYVFHVARACLSCIIEPAQFVPLQHPSLHITIYNSMDRSYIPYSSHGGDYSMNSRRLVRLLQAVSYDIPDRGHSVPARDICENRISIEEAIALYMQTAAQIQHSIHSRIVRKCRSRAT